MTISKESFNQLILTILIIGLSFYPIIAIFTLSFLTIYEKRLNNFFIFGYTVLFFTLIFYLRLYGSVTSINGSSDDAITYLRIYSILENYGYLDFFKQAALQGVNTLEPLHWFVYYCAGELSNYNKSIFVFLNYFIPILIFLYSLKLLFKEKYLLAFLLISTFAYQYYYALVFSTWRQSFSFSIIVLSLYFLANSRNKTVIFLLLSSVFIHLSSVIYLFIYLLYMLKNSKLKLSTSIVTSSIMFIVLFFILQYYNDILSEKVSGYTSGKHLIEQVRISFIVKFIGAIIISIIILKRSYKFKDIQLQVLSFFVMVGNILVLLTMNLGTVTTRLQLSINILFLIMLSYYISKYHNYNNKIYIFVLLGVFIIFIRLTIDNSFFSMFLLEGNFDEILTYSIGDYLTLLLKKRGFE